MITIIIIIIIIKSHAGNSRNFIRIIKKYLIENVIYNLEEFFIN